METSQIGLQNFYRVYQVHNKEDGTQYRRLMGTFALIHNVLHIITDYHGWLRRLVGSGQMDGQMQRRLDSVKRSMHLDLVSEADIHHGYRPDLLPEKVGLGGENGGGPDEEINVDNKSAARPPSRWNLYTVGHDKPDILEIKDGQLQFNGHQLSEREREYILKMLHSGEASIRYPKVPFDSKTMAKMEGKLENLAKASIPGLHPPANPEIGDEEYRFDSLIRTEDERNEANGYADFDKAFENEIKPLHESGAMSPETFNLIRKRAYEDGMAEGIGNKASYFSFLKGLEKNRERGTHIMIDGNDFKSINDNLSHAHGDQAIRMYGMAFRRAVDNGVGRDSVKMHRFGGDEFHVWVKEMPGESNEEHNARVARVLRDMRSEIQKATPPEAFPELNSSHKLSFSAGVAKSPAAADAALNDMAKVAKKAANKPKGQAGFHFHSILKGMNGPVDPHEPGAPQIAPSAPAPVPAPAPSVSAPAAPQPPLAKP